MGISGARRRRAAIALGSATALLTTVIAGAPARAVSGPIDCPEVYPTEDVVTGLEATGYTVSQGTEPDPFDVYVLGRVTDGIAPGVDLIMAELDSPAIDAAGGVWAGMSGSPVYTDDGELIGAVSYSLGTNSVIAGLTPAETMVPLLTGDTPTPGVGAVRALAHLPSRVRLDRERSRALIRATGVSASTVRRGFGVLTPPLGISGAGRATSGPALDRLAATLGDPVVYGAGTSRASVTPTAAEDVHAGGNFAAVLAYGDVSAYSVGTTTLVCDGRAVAFGHPDQYTGDVDLGAALAEAVVVQPDSFAGPFKVANLTSPAGTVDLDSLTGIAATLGQSPQTALDVVSTLTNDAARTHTGTSLIVDADIASDAAAYHAVLAVEQALGSAGPGSGDLTIDIRGTADGTPFRITRSDKYLSRGSLSYDVGDVVYALLQGLLDQELGTVTLTRVRIAGTVSKKQRGFAVNSLRINKNGHWVTTRRPVTVESGGTVSTRMVLTRVDTQERIVRRIRATVPRVPRGSVGYLEVSAGAGPWMWDWSEADSLPELIAMIRDEPLGSSVYYTVTFDEPEVSATVQLPISAAIQEFSDGAEVFVD